MPHASRAVLALLPLLAACGQTAAPAAQPRFDAIAPDETITLVGTEPFWAATISGGTMIYKTPDNQAGTNIPVERFAGNAGLGFSGRSGGRSFDLTVTKGQCSDGMSDRSFPFTVTLRVESEQRQGCAFTDRQPFTEGTA